MLLCERRHAKMDIKIFVVLIPKEGLACMTLVIVYNQCRQQNTILLVAVIPKEGLVPAYPSFGMTTTKILRPILLDAAQCYSRLASCPKEAF